MFDQLQLSLEQSQLIDQALYMNNKTTDFSVNRDGSALDFCRLHDITIQAWSPLQFGMFGGSFIDNPDFPEMNKALAEIAEREGVSKAAVAIAWILRHPANMQAIILALFCALLIVGMLYLLILDGLKKLFHTENK